MAKESGHRLFIEICRGSSILDDAIDHLSLYRDSGKRMQELFRACVSAGCVMDDVSGFSGVALEEVAIAIELIESSPPEDRMTFRFRLHNDEDDSFFPGFTDRYLKLSRAEKRIYVTKMYLLGFWFFTRFSKDYGSLMPMPNASGSNVSNTRLAPDADQAPTIIEVNEEAADLLGGLDICL